MAKDELRARLAELVSAFALLTRLPVAGLLSRLPGATSARAIWAYPLAGAAVGLIGGGVYWVGLALSLPPALAAVWGLAAMVLATGALHEDGLADFADGFGGQTRERRLEIMRDSRMGVYGAIALMLSLGVRATAIALLAEPWLVLAGLVAVGAASRAGAGLVMAAVPAARADGLAAATGRPGWMTAWAGFGISILIGMIVLAFSPALGVLASALLAALLLGGLARARLGGQTGDVLGACVQAGECLALTALVAFAA